MRMVAHSGGCCGMRTIFGFGLCNQRNFDEFFRIFSEFRDGVRDWTSDGPTAADFQGAAVGFDRRLRYDNRLIEVVLTDGQLQNTVGNVDVNGQMCSSWLDVLLSLGFRRVSRFRNSNSGSYCTVFHFVRTLENNWEEAAPTPTVVFTYYRKVYASGNVGLTMYPTIFEAFNGHRGRYVNKYEVLSDASVRVTERLTPDAE